MMHRAGSSIVEVPYCFSRSYVKFQGHTALKIVEFDPNWAFPDSNSSLNSPMAMKCCTKLETAKERCPIVFQCHPLNFKVTRDKTSPILTLIGRFRTIGRSQLSNPSDLPCYGGKCLKNFFLYFIERISLVFSGWWFPSIYWVLLPSKIEEWTWSHLVNLLVRSTCTLALRMELESSSNTVASKVYIVIWNKTTLGGSLIVLKYFFILYLVSKDIFRGNIMLYFCRWPVAALFTELWISHDRLGPGLREYDSYYEMWGNHITARNLVAW